MSIFRPAGVKKRFVLILAATLAMTGLTSSAVYRAHLVKSGQVDDTLLSEILKGQAGTKLVDNDPVGDYDSVDDQLTSHFLGFLAYQAAQNQQSEASSIPSLPPGVSGIQPGDVGIDDVNGLESSNENQGSSSDSPHNNSNSNSPFLLVGSPILVTSIPASQTVVRSDGSTDIDISEQNMLRPDDFSTSGSSEDPYNGATGAPAPPLGGGVAAFVVIGIAAASRRLRRNVKK